MRKIKIELSTRERKTLFHAARSKHATIPSTWAQVILGYSLGQGCDRLSAVLGLAPSTVINIGLRYLKEGIQGLIDRRCFNGGRKVTKAFKEALLLIVSASPLDFKYSRPTWTRELLAKVLKALTLIEVSRTTVGRICKELKINWKTARPICRCPWTKGKKKRKIAKLRKLVKRQTMQEPVFYSDEVDVHLNPKIGKDWTPAKTQRQIVTPGQNKKWYFAGAFNRITGALIAVEGPSKRSELFIELLKELRNRYRSAKILHLIVDNYIIHTSKITTEYIETTKRTEESESPEIKLHFLPPYSPEANPIERKWQDLHSNVTRNHQCKTIEELVEQAALFIAHGMTTKTEPMSPKALKIKESIKHL